MFVPYKIMFFHSYPTSLPLHAVCTINLAPGTGEAGGTGLMQSDPPPLPKLSKAQQIRFAQAQSEHKKQQQQQQQQQQPQQISPMAMEHDSIPEK
jgi:hypothetical protein